MMSTQIEPEVNAVNKLRAKYRNVGQRTLARRITERDFDNLEDRQLSVAASPVSCPEATTYSRIRRFDKAHPVGNIPVAA